jgi:Immunity protein Imm5
VSDAVDRAIEAALSALDDSPDGWLELPERRRLREAYGPWTPPYEPGGPDAGLLRRAALLVACARRALPAWEQSFPDDRRPHGLVEAILPALRGERAEEEVDAAAKALREDVERLGVDAERKEAFFAGIAAVHLPWEAWDGDLDPELDPPDMRDLDLDEPRIEALAAWALAGEDTGARRSYWRWYVTEAFPAAYAVAA